MGKPDLTSTSCAGRHWPNLGQHSCRNDKKKKGRKGRKRVTGTEPEIHDRLILPSVVHVPNHVATTVTILVASSTTVSGTAEAQASPAVLETTRLDIVGQHTVPEVRPTRERHGHGGRAQDAEAKIALCDGRDYLQLKPRWLRTHTYVVAVLVCVVLHCDT